MFQEQNITENQDFTFMLKCNEIKMHVLNIHF